MVPWQLSYLRDFPPATTQRELAKTTRGVGTSQALPQSPRGYISPNFKVSTPNIPAREHRTPFMDDDESAINPRIAGMAHAFGSLVRSRRKAMRMRQDQLALATGVGRRFVIDLEAGKPSCQLGRSLLVAKALGLDLAILASDAGSQSATAPELPEVAEEEEPDGYSIRLL